MKAFEFIDSLSRWGENHERDLDNIRVGVATQNGGCPTHHKSEIRDFGPGIDWDSGWLILWPAEPLVIVSSILDPRALARETLESRISAHVKVHGGTAKDYLLARREQCWIEGFEAGVRTHATACGNVREDASK